MKSRKKNDLSTRQNESLEALIGSIDVGQDGYEHQLNALIQIKNYLHEGGDVISQEIRNDLFDKLITLKETKSMFRVIEINYLVDDLLEILEL